MQHFIKIFHIKLIRFYSLDYYISGFIKTQYSILTNQNMFLTTFQTNISVHASAIFQNKYFSFLYSKTIRPIQIAIFIKRFKYAIYMILFLPPTSYVCLFISLYCCLSVKKILSTHCKVSFLSNKNYHSQYKIVACLSIPFLSSYSTI